MLLPRLVSALDKADRRCEVLVVDDCSEDASTQVFSDLTAGDPRFKLLRLDRRGGQTGAFAKAFPQCTGAYIIRMDADLQDHPEDLPAFFEKIDDGADLVVGLRECRQHSRFLRLASIMYDLLILMLLNSPLHSNSGSFVCFRAEFVRDVPLFKNDHRYLPLIAMERGATDIREVLVRHGKRQFGTSKYHPIFKVFFGVPEVLRFLFRLRRGRYGSSREIIHPVLRIDEAN